MSSDSVKRSCGVGVGIYQFEWRDDRIDIVQWNEPPTSTNQWVNICPNPDSESILTKYKTFYLEGTSNDDIHIVPVEDAFEWYSTIG